MSMPIGIAGAELTTAERQEFLLTVIASALTRKRPHEFLPWVRAGLSEFLEGFGNG